MRWYTQIVDDKQRLSECIQYYQEEMKEVRKEINVKGKALEGVCSRLPGLVEETYRKLQDIEAILEYLNIELVKMKSKYFRKYLEHYNRSLTSRDCEKFSEGEEEVFNQKILVNNLALLRNEYLGLMKGLDQLSFMVGHITKLKCAGLDDATL